MAALIGNPCWLGDIQHRLSQNTVGIIPLSLCWDALWGKLPHQIQVTCVLWWEGPTAAGTTLFQPFPTDLKLWRFSVNYLSSTSEQITANAKLSTGFRLEVFSVVSMPCGALLRLTLDVVRLKWCSVFHYEQEHPQKDFHYWASICHRFWFYSVHDL